MIGTWSGFIFILHQSIICTRADTIMSELLQPQMPYWLKDTLCHKLKCYESNDKCTQMLPTIGREFRPSNKTIFLIESSCHGGLRSRQMCAIESAAYANPNWQIIILFAGPLKTKFWKSKNYSFLKSIPNVRLYRVIPKAYTEGTPLEDIFLEDEPSLSRFPVVHTSDLLRILTLYKYGGLYLDMDMIVMKSFDTLPKNFVPRESRKLIASSIFAVSKDKIGKVFAEMTINDLADNYDPFSWNANTNGVYSRTLQKMCHTKVITEMDDKKCQGFSVLDYTLFFPISGRYWNLYYEPSDLPVSDYNAYTHHAWNSLGQYNGLHPDSLYFKLAQKYCSGTHSLYKDKFGQ